MTDLNRVYCKIRLYDNIFVFFREQQLPLELEKIRNVIMNHSSSLAILQTSLSKAALKERQSNEIAVAEENKSLKDKNELKNGLIAAGQENINFIDDIEIAKKQIRIKSLIETDCGDENQQLVEIHPENKSFSQNISARSVSQNNSAQIFIQNLDDRSTEEVNKHKNLINEKLITLSIWCCKPYRGVTTFVFRFPIIVISNKNCNCRLSKFFCPKL